MPECRRCGVVQPTCEVRRIRSDAKSGAGGYVCKDTVGCNRRRSPDPLEHAGRRRRRLASDAGQSCAPVLLVLALFWLALALALAWWLT